MTGEKLVLMLHLEAGQQYGEELRRENQRAQQSPAKLQAYSTGSFCWTRTFPNRFSQDQTQRLQNGSQSWTVALRSCRCETRSKTEARRGSWSFLVRPRRKWIDSSPSSTRRRGRPLRETRWACSCAFAREGIEDRRHRYNFPGPRVQLAREAYDQGTTAFWAVAAMAPRTKILNGVFAGRSDVQRIALGFLPLGTGNSFLRDLRRRERRLRYRRDRGPHAKC